MNINKLSFNISEIEHICPFYCLTNSTGTILNIGTSLKKILREETTKQIKGHISDWLEYAGEESDAQDWRLENIKAMQHRPFRVKCKNADIELACEAIEVSTNKWFVIKEKHWIVLMRPLLRNSEELDKWGLTLQDFSLIDPARTELVNMLMEESLRNDLIRAVKMEKYDDEE
jgi:hypothetical protein